VCSNSLGYPLQTPPTWLHWWQPDLDLNPNELTTISEQMALTRS
jgi:hypothetical protein